MNCTPIRGHAGSVERIRVGTMTLSHDWTFVDTFECAAWFQEVIVSAGATAELYTNGYWVFVKFDGVKGKSNFDSLVCGRVIGTNRDRGQGDPCSHTMMFYAYELARMLATGERPARTCFAHADIKLDDAFCVTEEPYRLASVEN